MRNPPLVERFWSRVDEAGSCWIWTGALNSDGYGRIRADGRDDYAHRVSLKLAGVEIPPGMSVDHLCRNRACVRPEHLEVVTQAENLYRGNGYSGRNIRKTRCVNGHEFTPENTRIRPGGHRKCRACHREQVARAAAARANLRAAVKAAEDTAPATGERRDDRRDEETADA